MFFVVKKWARIKAAVPSRSTTEAKKNKRKRVTSPFAGAPGQPPLHFLGNTDPLNTLGHAMPGEGGAIYAYGNLGSGGPDGFHDRSRDYLLVRIVNGRIEWIVGDHDGKGRTDGSVVGDPPRRQRHSSRIAWRFSTTPKAVCLPSPALLLVASVFMRLFRFNFCILLVLLWWPVTNSCLIASVLPEMMEPACECGGEQEENEGLPCGTKDCAPCATLENGVNLAALQHPAVPQPVMTVTDSLTALLEKSARRELATLAEPPPVPPPMPPPAWRSDVTKALPVRGPSFAV